VLTPDATAGQRGMPGRTVAAIGGVGFTPLHLPGLALWLDASDTSTITASGGAVSQWNDKSGLGRNVSQATGSLQPTTGANTQNGLNVLTLSGDLLRTATTTTIADPISVFAVSYVRSGAGVADRRVLTHNDSINWQFNEGYSISGSGVTVELYAGVGVSAGATYTQGVWRVMCGVDNGTASYAASNGIVGTIGDAGSFSLGLGAVGAKYDGTQGLDGRLAELIVCSVAVSTSQRIQTEQYLAAKWGL
jgi:hypothetical protein